MVYGQFIYNGLSHIHVHRDLIVRRGDIHGRNTRGSSDLCVPFCRLGRLASSFPAVHLRLYNGLPLTMREMRQGSFERAVRSLLLCSPAYSVEEGFEMCCVNVGAGGDGRHSNDKK